MNWIIRGMGHYSAPYRVYHSVKGYEAWIYGKHGCACLGRGLGLEAAKALCAADKAKEGA